LSYAPLGSPSPDTQKRYAIHGALGPENAQKLTQA